MNKDFNEKYTNLITIAGTDNTFMQISRLTPEEAKEVLAIGNLLDRYKMRSNLRWLEIKKEKEND